MSHNRIRLPKSRFGRTLLSLAVTAAVGFGYFYVTLPALNPHAGEFARLTGRPLPLEDPLTAARDFARDHRCVLVLKGHRTVTAAPDGRAWINTTGNPGLSRGGSGDALAGMTAALLACGLPAYEAAACAVYLHGAAADRATAFRGEYGMLPQDLFAQLGRLFAEHHR